MRLRTLLSHTPEFIEVVNRSWTSYKKRGGVSKEDARRRLGLDKPARKGRRRTR